jgi:hypothetical protein
VRNTYSTAAIATLDGALKLSASWGLVPVKSMVAVLARVVVELVRVLAVAQPGDGVPDRLGRVLLNVPHVRVDHVEAVLGDHAVELLDALLVGRDLGSQVGQVGARVP